MDRETNQFEQISEVYSRFSEKNRDNLVKAAKSLLKAQNQYEVMLAQSEAREANRRYPPKAM